MEEFENTEVPFHLTESPTGRLHLQPAVSESSILTSSNNDVNAGVLQPWHQRRTSSEIILRSQYTNPRRVRDFGGVQSLGWFSERRIISLTKRLLSLEEESHCWQRNSSNAMEVQLVKSDATERAILENQQKIQELHTKLDKLCTDVTARLNMSAERKRISSLVRQQRIQDTKLDQLAVDISSKTRESMNGQRPSVLANQQRIHDVHKKLDKLSVDINAQMEKAADSQQTDMLETRKTMLDLQTALKKRSRAEVNSGSQCVQAMQTLLIVILVALISYTLGRFSMI